MVTRRFFLESNLALALLAALRPQKCEPPKPEPLYPSEGLFPVG